MKPAPRIPAGTRIIIETGKLGRLYEATVREWSPSGKFVSVTWADAQANGLGAFEWMTAQGFRERLVEVLDAT